MKTLKWCISYLFGTNFEGLTFKRYALFMESLNATFTEEESPRPQRF